MNFTEINNVNTSIIVIVLQFEDALEVIPA